MNIFKKAPYKFISGNESAFCRAWGNSDFGTGKQAPIDGAYGNNGGVGFHAPIRFQFAATGAGKPEKNK